MSAPPSKDGQAAAVQDLNNFSLKNQAKEEQQSNGVLTLRSVKNESQ